ncbi:Chitinase-3-like protein 2-like [Homarus americanus]|uniref:Chitinase-3-like protein 2-like n=1 Tax=Homarus americanus TaxID=6706 RepID=A0A8J5N0K1_HOMAM|nr:Chitinase-3-like protein 2-like [Homarus americanus]
MFIKQFVTKNAVLEGTDKSPIPKSNSKNEFVTLLIRLMWVLLIIAVCCCLYVPSSSTCNGMQDSSTFHRFFVPDAQEGILRNGSSTEKKIVCYYALPNKGSSEATMSAKDIDPTLCTHIIISKAKIENSTIVPLDEGDLKVYAEVVSLKKQNPDLHVLLSLGSGFPSLVQDLTHGFDGLDLDWEFPVWPSWKKNSKEKNRFAYFVLQLNNALKLASHPPLLLTAAVGVSKNIIDNSYEIGQLAKCVDFVSVMGYNYHQFKPYLPFTGHNAPLAKSSQEKGYFATLNIQWDTLYWMSKGMPKEKLVIGIPTFGRTWKLLNSKWHNVGAPAVAEGMHEGKITYLEACIFVKEGAVHYFDNESKVPYAVRDQDWVSYEDTVSIRDKVQWILAAGVAGVMTWNLNSDDWAGLCSGKKFELLNIVKDMLYHSFPKN